MEGKFLSGRFAHAEDVAVLCRAIFHDRDQLHFSPHPRDTDDRELEDANTRGISICIKSAAKDHALVKAARLCRHIGIFLESRRRAWQATRSSLVSASADFQKRHRCLELISPRT